jgi:hypothetical protein
MFIRLLFSGIGFTNQTDMLTEHHQPPNEGIVGLHRQTGSAT